MGFWQKTKNKVKIIFPNGESLRFHTPITVRELILQYPHHYCVPYVPGSSLSMNDELQGGKTYLLLPRPSPPISNYNPPTSNSRPSNEIDLSLKRARTWTPSLQIIAENDNISLQQQPNSEQRSVKKHEDTKHVKSASVRSKSALNRNAWLAETGIVCIAPIGSAGFLI
ncbi:hypothetical protein KI387_017836 [Taxus chinensis]|uniref:Uncharacterized protein n=1 Tax=Taxus chinensis TaxID=29808 RepID=A0AA38LJF7_TAXCH|nr:hypothetical protein KI387_017836 [Taxus chinensis]